MIYQYHDCDKNYDQVFTDDAIGVFAWFKTNTSSSSHTMPIWVINSDWVDRQSNKPPTFADWRQLALDLVGKSTQIDLFLRYTQKNKDCYYIDHRAIGKYKQSPKSFCGQTQYPDWFVSFLQSGGDASLIPATAPKSKPVLKRGK